VTPIRLTQDAVDRGGDPQARASADQLVCHERELGAVAGVTSRGQLLGSMSIFTTREAAEEFAAGDPFVLNGVVSGWQIREWNEVLVPA
jgi:hypothetical protein